MNMMKPVKVIQAEKIVSHMIKEKLINLTLKEPFTTKDV